ncbi:DUF4158 domain-containing protein [Streptosporangium roseum]|uniref:DUF4158 domain-containing protein n=1 Tax=Streptosporangium roseum TaxID=2001 RepID=UPI003317143A
MPVDFLSDSEATKYGRYDGPPSRVEMEKIFFLDNEDMALIKAHRGRHIRCGFALQLVTMRYLGCFLADPLEVPNEVLDVVAGQLGIEDPSCVKRYTERDKTRLEHTWEIAKAFGLKDFASAEAELAGKVRAHAWNTGDGPTACFQYAVRWLRQNDVLLPGISTLTRLVARERERATRELHDTLAALPSAQQRAALDLLLEVPPGKKVSDLERWRSGPSKASGPQIVKSLDLVAEIGGTELGRLELDAAVPQRRLDELARYGLTAHSSHPPS